MHHFSLLLQCPLSVDDVLRVHTHPNTLSRGLLCFQISAHSLSLSLCICFYGFLLNSVSLVSLHLFWKYTE
ncbi:hypothetical protein XELAEV_18039764mg [Xenopus laevis]|uniref:Uncharacterized protein n=1 Tax=Xenopus laevis TaxID=8355 RepID=A0A974H889_XENLA|nr:hypothetical protein XELAEV_18039764mg [Xenopus laevis]